MLNTASQKTPQRSHAKLFAVAKRIRELEDDVDRMKLQKLLYFIQGSSLAATGGALFPEAPEAWTHGPVYRDVWIQTKHSESVEIDCADSSIITRSEDAIIRTVVDTFRGTLANEMSKLTHNTDPWTEARAGVAADERSDKLIPHCSMMRYFSLHPTAGVNRVEMVGPRQWPRVSDKETRHKIARWLELLDRLGA